MTLDELKALEAAATPGPWEYAHGNVIDHWELWNPKTSEYVVQDDSGVEPRTEDLALIAAARTMLPRLIAVAEAAAWAQRVGAGYDDDCDQALRAALAALEAP